MVNHYNTPSNITDITCPHPWMLWCILWCIEDVQITPCTFMDDKHSIPSLHAPVKHMFEVIWTSKQTACKQYTRIQKRENTKRNRHEFHIVWNSICCISWNLKRNAKTINGQSFTCRIYIPSWEVLNLLMSLEEFPYAAIHSWKRVIPITIRKSYRHKTIPPNGHTYEIEYQHKKRRNGHTHDTEHHYNGYEHYKIPTSAKWPHLHVRHYIMVTDT